MNIEEELHDSAGDQLQTIIERNLVKFDRIRTGALLKSISYEKTNNGFTIEALDYLRYVDTRPSVTYKDTEESKNTGSYDRIIDVSVKEFFETFEFTDEFIDEMLIQITQKFK